MILDTIGRSLEAVLAANVTTTPLPWVAQWADVDAVGNVLFTQQAAGTLGTTSSHAAVTVIPAPASDAARKPRHLSVTNVDMVAATVTVRFNDAGTTYNLFVVTLAVGDKLEWEDGVPLAVKDSAGNLK